jgi:hypothetical protein
MYFNFFAQQFWSWNSPLWVVVLKDPDIVVNFRKCLDFSYSLTVIVRRWLTEKVISLTSEWHFVKNFFFKIGLETNLE